MANEPKELIELFLTGVVGTSGEAFKAKFSRLVRTVPKIHSPLKPEFFPYFFLGGALTVQYTELENKIGIKNSCVKITSSKTIKLAFKIEKDGKTKLVFKTITVVGELGDGQHLAINELKEALGSLGLTSNKLNNCEIEGEIVHIKDGEVSLEKLKVAGKGELNSEILRNLGPLSKYNEQKAKFKKVENKVDGVNFEDALKKFSDWKKAKEGVENFLKHSARIYRSEKVLSTDSKDNREKKLQLLDSEAAYHGFTYGVLAMNFKYKYALDIRAEPIAGKGYADLMVISRYDESKNKRWDSPLCTFEGKRGERETGEHGVGQIKRKKYDRSQPPVRAIVKTEVGQSGAAKGRVRAGFNYSLDPDLGGVLVEDAPEFIESKSFKELFFENLAPKEEIERKLNYLYYSISDSNGGGKNTNYLSRLVLGELLADNTLEKRVFIYEGNHIKPGSAEHDTRSRKVPEDVTIPMNKMISTFVLKVKDDKYVILNIIEGEDFRIEKSIPLNGLGIDLSNKCTQVNIKVNPKANGGFEVEGDTGKSYYQGIEIGPPKTFQDEYKGEFKEIKHVDILDGESKFQKQNLAEALFPLRRLIIAESDFQAVVQGLLTAQAFDEKAKAEGKIVRVFTESNHSGNGRADLVFSILKKDGEGQYREEKIRLLELKHGKSQLDAERKHAEGATQIVNYVFNLKILTDLNQVEEHVIVFNSGAKNSENLLIKTEEEDIDIIHSSQDSRGSPAKREHIPSPEEQKLSEVDLQSSCPSSKRRKTRSIGMLCMDSRDEESIEEEEGKEELIKELFDSDEIRERIKNVEFYDQLYKISKQISRGETINENAKETFIERVKDINLNSIDLEIRDVVVKIKGDLSKGRINKGLRSILRGSGVAEKIGKVAKDAGLDRTAFLTKNNKIQEYIDKINSNPEVMGHLNRVSKISGWAMEGMMYKNLIGDILSGNLEGVAINLGFIAGSPLLSKMAEAASAKGLKLVSGGRVFLGQTLRITSPFLARATSAFIAYDLVNQVKAFKSGDKDAIAGIAGDSIALTVDSAAIGIEIAEVAGILSGVSSITGPIGAGVTALVFIGTDIYSAVKKVEQEDKIIHLTLGEKTEEWFRALFHMKPEEYIEEFIEEKLANDYLVENAVNFLKQHTGIQRYVFPTGKLIERKRIEVDLNNKVLLNEKRSNIKWSRARPDNPRDGELFCLPKGDWESVPGGGAYLCENAIGLSYSTNRTGNYTLIDLGGGNDEVIGFQNSPNIFLVGNGFNNLTGGSKDDFFILQGNDYSSGIINGGHGSDTLDLTKFALGCSIKMGETPFGYFSTSSDGKDTYSSFKSMNIQKILGREKEQDEVECSRDLKYVDGRGGKDNNHPDRITIDHATKLKVAVRPNTEIINRSHKGNFDYIAFHGRGIANIYINHQTDKLQHSFLFSYTLSELKKVEVENLSGEGTSYPIKNTEFSFQQSPSGVFDINIINAGNNASYVLTEDKTEVKIGNEGSLYLLQNTNKPINEIVRNYPAIVNRLNATVFVKIQDEFIVMGHGKHEIISNDPLHDSHLIGNGGENVYVITPTQKEINIYDVDEESSIDTLNLCNVMKEVQNVLLKVSQSGNDLLIKLEGGESLLKFPIRLKNGVQWYRKLHVVLNINMQLERNGNNWILSPLPLIFDENTKTIVITAKDIEEGNKLIIHKQAGRYTFLRLRDDLIIITDPSLGESNACTILLSNFYKEPKMETLSIEFKGITISLQEKMIEINEAVAFCPRVLQINKEFSINNSNLLSHYDCLKFNSDKMLFLKLGNRLLLLSDKGKLLMSNYYSDVDEKWSLLVELNDDIITSEEFRKRAKNASPFRYYQPGEEGLEIYHNQPDNKHQIGLIDLKNKSILDCSEEIIDGDFILSSKGEAIAKVKNWNIYQHARKVMFAFGDAMIYNKKCTISNCNPEDIIEEFKREIAKLINKKDEDGNTLLHHAAMKGDLDKAKLFVEKGADIHEKNNFNMTPLNVAHKFKQKEVAKFLDKERKNEESKQRHRRHHIRHENHHSGHRSPIQEVASSGTRPSSWINDLFGWVKDSVGRLLGSQVALPGTQSLPKESTSNSKPKVTTLKADLSQVDVNGTILLLDTFIRKFTGQKYISSNTRGITEQEALGYVLSVTEKFREVVEQAALKSSISIHRLNIDFMKIQEEITGKIISGKFNEIPGILRSYAEKALPGREVGCPGKLSQKKFDKFMTEFNSIIDPVINQPMQQILSRESMLKESNVKEQEITLKPKSYLNGVSIQGHLTQDRGLRNQGRALIP